MSEVIQSQIQTWRQKSRDGTITPEEMREAIAAIRKERVGASQASAGAKTARATKAAKAAPIDSEALLNSLM
jgi:Arc/MetJ-type ribon-helix-helix transcriptional regulator